MVKILSDDRSISPSLLYECGIREGLELAARIADRHSALPEDYEKHVGDAMPNSAQAFALQKVVARQMASKIREMMNSRATGGAVASV